MNLPDVPLLSMLRERMTWLNAAPERAVAERRQCRHAGLMSRAI